jgi:hypothetical protein
LRSNIKGYGGKTHKTDSQNSDKTAPTGRELYHLQFSLQAASLETFGYTLVYCAKMIKETTDMETKEYFWDDREEGSTTRETTWVETSVNHHHHHHHDAAADDNITCN